jgi:hypothetical protein
VRAPGRCSPARRVAEAVEAGRAERQREAQRPALAANGRAASCGLGRERPGASGADARLHSEARSAAGRSSPAGCSCSWRQPARPQLELPPGAPRPDAAFRARRSSHDRSRSWRVVGQEGQSACRRAKQRVERPQREAEAARPEPGTVRGQARAAQRADREPAAAAGEAGRGSPADRRSGVPRGTRTEPAAQARRSGRRCRRRRLRPRPHRAGRRASRDAAASRRSRRRSES